MSRDRDTFDMFSTPDRGRFGDNEMRDDAPGGGRVTGASDLVDVMVALHHDTGARGGDKTGKAILVSLDGDEARAQWLPHSLVEMQHMPGKYVGGIRKDGWACQFAAVTVTLPAKMAKEKGLI
jgi:hypothetical protein